MSETVGNGVLEVIENGETFPEEVGVAVDGFKADARHWAYLRLTATRLEAPLSLREISAEIDVPFQTIWEWQQNPMFQDWISANRTRWMHGQIQNVYSVMLAKAYEGNIGAARVFLQRYDPDYDPRTRKAEGETNITDGMVVEFVMARIKCTKADVLMLIAGKAQIAHKDEIIAPTAKPLGATAKTINQDGPEL